jgi:hypothetical protein
MLTCAICCTPVRANKPVATSAAAATQANTGFDVGLRHLLHSRTSQYASGNLQQQQQRQQQQC